MGFYRILQHVYHGNGIPTTYWYDSAPTPEAATAKVREYNARNVEANNDPTRILITYSIDC